MTFRIAARTAVAGLLVSLATGLSPAQALAAAPTGLHARWSTYNQMQLDWDSMSGAYGYRVLYSTDSTFASGVTSKATAASDLLLSSLTARKTYYFKVAVIDNQSRVVSEWSAVAHYSTKPPPAQLIVGSFNIKRPDSTRARYVARDICEEWLDVVGIQEAYSGPDTMLAGLQNTCGSRGYVATDEASDSGDLLLYRSSTVDLLDHGYLTFRKQDSDTSRVMVWARFRHKGNGHEFFFVTTHLTPGDKDPTINNIRTAQKKDQWEQIIGWIPLKNINNAPVIVSGDFNTSKFRVPADTMLAKMRSEGYGDVLGQLYRSYDTYKPRAVTQIDVRTNSFNDFNPRYTDYTVSRGVGNNIDWIFAANALKVSRWRTVMHKSNGQLASPIPSDHSLVTARLTLP